MGSLQALLSQLIATAKADIAKTVLPALSQFLTAIAAALPKDPANVAQQVAFQAAIVAATTQFNAAVLAGLPQLGQDVSSQLAAMLNTEAQNLLNLVPKS